MSFNSSICLVKSWAWLTPNQSSIGETDLRAKLNVEKLDVARRPLRKASGLCFLLVKLRPGSVPASKLSLLAGLKQWTLLNTICVCFVISLRSMKYWNLRWGPCFTRGSRDSWQILPVVASLALPDAAHREREGLAATCFFPICIYNAAINGTCCELMIYESIQWGDIRSGGLITRILFLLI